MYSKIIIIVTLLLPVTGFSMDYFELEQHAETILCDEKQSIECQKAQITNLVDELEPLVVEGTVLPSDALRDPEQQIDLIPSGLYIKEDGSVGDLDSGPGLVVVAPPAKKGPTQIFTNSFEPFFPIADELPLVIQVPSK